MLLTYFMNDFEIKLLLLLLLLMFGNDIGKL
jgi:hypothetical protein